MASAAGTITVAIVGDTSRFNKSLTDTQRRVSLFGAAATAALVAFGVQSVKAFAESEQAQTKLNFALAKAPKLTGLTAESMAAYNKTLAEKVAIDDDVIAGAEAVLARFASTEDQLKSLTSLSADYARVTGTDITSAASTVGKALLGNTRALKALGISYTATGNAAKDAAAIQDLLNQKIGGFAETYAGTAAGQVEELKRQYGELQETIGAGLLPPLETLLGIVTPLVKGFGDLPKPVQQAVFGLATLAAVSATVGPRLLAVKANMALVQQQAAQAEQPVGMFTKALGSSAAVLPVVGLALTAGIAIFSMFSQKNQEAEAANRAFADQLNLTTGAITGSNAAVAAKTLADEGALQIAQQFGVSTSQLTTAVLAGGDAYDRVAKQVEAYIAADDVANTKENYVAKQKLLETLTGLHAAVEEGTSQQQAATEATNANATAAEKDKAALDKLAAGVDRMNQAWQRFVGVELDARQAELSRMSAMHDLIDLAKQSGTTHAALASQIITTVNAIEAERESTSKTAAGQRAATHDAIGFVKQMINIARTAGAAKVDIDNLRSALAQLQGQGQTDLSVTTHVNRGAAVATGGMIVGPGTGTSDSIPTMLSNGEYVINARSASRIGLSNLNRLNRMADGGAVGGHWGAQFLADSKFMAKLDELVKAAKDQLHELKQQRKDFAQGVSSGLMGGLTLSGGIRDGRDNDARSILGRYRQQANKIKRFMRDMTKLQKKGLSRALTAEILDMGSDEGGTMARILLSDSQLLGKFNRVYSSLDDSTTRFGNQTSQRWYGNRIDEARKDYRNAKHTRNQFEHEAQHIINTTLHVHGSVWSEKELIKAITPKLREEFKTVSRRNR